MGAVSPHVCQHLRDVQENVAQTFLTGEGGCALPLPRTIDDDHTGQPVFCWQVSLWGGKSMASSARPHHVVDRC